MLSLTFVHSLLYLLVLLKYENNLKQIKTDWAQFFSVFPSFLFFFFCLLKTFHVSGTVLVKERKMRGPISWSGLVDIPQNMAASLAFSKFP